MDSLIYGNLWGYILFDISIVLVARQPLPTENSCMLIIEPLINWGITSCMYLQNTILLGKSFVYIFHCLGCQATNVQQHMVQNSVAHPAVDLVLACYSLWPHVVISEKYLLNYFNSQKRQCKLHIFSVFVWKSKDFISLWVGKMWKDLPSNQWIVDVSNRNKYNVT